MADGRWPSRKDHQTRTPAAQKLRCGLEYGVIGANPDRAAAWRVLSSYGMDDQEAERPFDRIDARFAEINARFDAVDAHVVALESRAAATALHIGALEKVQKVVLTELRGLARRRWTASRASAGGPRRRS